MLIHAQQYLDLSEQYVLGCSGGGSCDGGVPYYTFENITKTGIPLESAMPYEAISKSYTKTCSPVTFQKLSNDILSVHHYTSLTKD